MILTLAAAYLTLWGSFALTDWVQVWVRKREIAKLEAWFNL